MHIQYERDDPECLTSFIFEEGESEQMSDFQCWLKDNNMTYKKIRVPGNKSRMTCLIVESAPTTKQFVPEPVVMKKVEPVQVAAKQVVPEPQPVKKVEAEEDVSEGEEEEEEEVEPVQVKEEPKKNKFFEEDDEEQSESEDVQFKKKEKKDKKDKKHKK